jgi:IS5 family transposase
MGLAKKLTLFGLAANAHNIAKGSKFLTLYGMPNPEHIG